MLPKMVNASSASQDLSWLKVESVICWMLSVKNIYLMASVSAALKVSNSIFIKCVFLISASAVCISPNPLKFALNASQTISRRIWDALVNNKFALEMIRRMQKNAPCAGVRSLQLPKALAC
jgi:hypothetical protein